MPKYQCDNCSYRADESHFLPAQHLSERLTPGCTYTDCECPKCGALAYPVKPAPTPIRLVTIIEGGMLREVISATGNPAVEIVHIDYDTEVSLGADSLDLAHVIHPDGQRNDCFVSMTQLDHKTTHEIGHFLAAFKRKERAYKRKMKANLPVSASE